MRNGLLVIAILLVFAVSANAWNATGHMAVAYIAYKRLDPAIRGRVDILLKRNPEYKGWIADAPAGQEGLVAFLNASVWADCIKGDSCYGYLSEGPNNGNQPPDDPSASWNIGYADRSMHKYWHFVDLPYSPTGLPVQPTPTVNAATQIERMRTAIQGRVSDDIKSYDVVWLIHLVGDIHQPLHAISRFTRLQPNGDAGGNLVQFCNAPCEAPTNLHAYWDNLVGNKTDLSSIASLASAVLDQPAPPFATITDVNAWSEQSAALAKQYAYAPPISGGNDPEVKLSPRPTVLYDGAAQRVARRQILLAGYRLAYLLNGSLK